jgi:predicted MFS family arabinose efflux permease
LARLCAGSRVDNRISGSNTVGRAIATIIAMWCAAQLQRVAPPAYVGASSLMVDLGTTAAGAGLLAAVYFPVYGLMQIPSGILADQVSPRRNLILGGLAMTVAGLAFALAPTLELAVIARAFVGITAGLFWLSSLKLFSTLPGGAYAKRMSYIVSIGSVASILGLAGLPALLTLLHWRVVAALLCVPTLLMALFLIATPMPIAERRSAPSELWARSLDALRKIPGIAGRLDFWAVAVIAMLWTGNQFALQTWLPRFGRDVLEMPSALTGILPALLPLGMIIGSTIIGSLHGRHPYFRIPLYIAFFLAYILSLTVLATGLATRAGPISLFALLIWMGLLNASFFVPLAWIGGRVESGLLGTASGVMNGLSFLPAFFMPWLMGVVMDAVDRPTSSAWRYSPDAYYLAFGFSLATLVFALIVSTGLYVRLRLARRKAEAQPG